MKGYIKRLSQEIEQLDAKMQALVAFKDNPREPINDKQYELLCKQEVLMGQLLDVLKARLANEQEIHPDYFEDLPTDEWHQQELPFDDDDTNPCSFVNNSYFVDDE